MQTPQQLHKHFRRYMNLSLLTFVAVLLFSLLFIILDDPTGISEFRIPIEVHYLGVFISSMMMVMGMYYIRLMHTRLHLEFTCEEKETK